jgi:hypothetical protein
MLIFNVNGTIHICQSNVWKMENINGSYFESCLKIDSSSLTNGMIQIDRRNSDVFRHILYYLEFGTLPRNKRSECMLNLSTISDLHEEADHFRLAALAAECSELLAEPDCGIQDYFVDGEILTTSCKPDPIPELTWQCVYLPTDDENVEDLVKTVASFNQPFCISDQLLVKEKDSRNPLFKSSTLADLNLAELVEWAEPSCFGLGEETVFDPQVRHSLEIRASELNQAALESVKYGFIKKLSALSDTMRFYVKPFKMVIYPEGGHFGEHVDSVRGKNHVGTVIYFCQSDFTGGELEISAQGTSHRFGEPNTWVAMYGDCTHRVLPVTSGNSIIVYPPHNISSALCICVYCLFQELVLHCSLICTKRIGIKKMSIV